MPRYVRRVSSSASCAPLRRPSGTVLAPASSATPPCMNSAAVAMACPSSSATKQVAHSTLDRAKPVMKGSTSGISLQPRAAMPPYQSASSQLDASGPYSTRALTGAAVLHPSIGPET